MNDAYELGLNITETVYGCNYQDIDGSRRYIFAKHVVDRLKNSMYDLNTFNGHTVDRVIITRYNQDFLLTSENVHCVMEVDTSIDLFAFKIAILDAGTRSRFDDLGVDDDVALRFTLKNLTEYDIQHNNPMGSRLEVELTLELRV